MNKTEAFIDFFDYLVTNCKESVEIPKEVLEYLDSLRSQETEKPLFTESGLEILEYLQSQPVKGYKAKEIADGMGVSSRKVSGAIRKLVTDNFVEKYGKSPVIYTLTDEGKNFDIKNYKEKMNNGEKTVY